MSIVSVMPSNHLILCRPLLLLPSIFPRIRVFSESVPCIKWPKYWSFSFSFSISPSSDTQDWSPSEWTGSISLQSKGLSRVFSNTKASILYAFNFLFSTFFIVQLSQPYKTTERAIALTIRTFMDKVMSLLFLYPVWVFHSFSSKEQMSFNFMAAVTVHSDFDRAWREWKRWLKTQHSKNCFREVIYLLSKMR